jgi:hypothetical protein
MDETPTTAPGVSGACPTFRPVQVGSNPGSRWGGSSTEPPIGSSAWHQAPSLSGSCPTGKLLFFAMLLTVMPVWECCQTIEYVYQRVGIVMLLNLFICIEFSKWWFISTISAMGSPIVLSLKQLSLICSI